MFVVFIIPFRYLFYSYVILKVHISLLFYETNQLQLAETPKDKTNHQMVAT